MISILEKNRLRMVKPLSQGHDEEQICGQTKSSGLQNMCSQPQHHNETSTNAQSEDPSLCRSSAPNQ